MTYLTSRVGEELAAARSEQQAAELVSKEFASVQEQVKKLQEKADIIARVESRINVANVLAELSFLVDEKVVLSKVKISAEKFVEDGSTRSRGVSVRTASGGSGGKGASGGDWGGDVRFKVVISGIAVDASCVAELICRLEESPYFCLVYPSFSRNSQIKGQTRKSNAEESSWRLTDNYQVSKFEISCYLANYQWQEEHLTGESRPGKGGA